ncbi:neuronal PAS domain-containing protein 4-like [Brachionichthys hirsutus]|uniref:neuronal PAS domain-containing protein 4-like n=1 Tax=Brachionichthys hirsutus TaxID=412623 RepID=UPI0036043B5A
MPIWCNTCRCHVSSPCASHHLPEDQRTSYRKFRSTKGASKARRDHINHEIRNMRALLPMAQEDRERLSYLHSMAAICTYIRKSVLFQGLPAGGRSNCYLSSEAFLPALHGFILVTTAQGRLVYVSENVAEYLGLSMVDVLQSDSFYGMVERSDVAIVKSNLDIKYKSSSERSFICGMQTSKTFKMHHGSCCSMMVRGRFRTFPFSSSACTPNQSLFVALCTPTVNQLHGSDSHRCSTFSSVHRMDMTFTHLSDSVSYFLGYSAEELIGQSWYGLVHPEDLSLSAASHTSLMEADEGFQVEMVLRLQCNDLSWTWLYIQANKDPECQRLCCTNFIISETEAKYIRTKIGSDAFRPPSPADSSSVSAQQAPLSYNRAKRFKRQRTSNSQSEEPPGTRARRGSEPDLHYVPSTSTALLADAAALYTPPYSPASSSSSLQQEDLSRDLLMDVQGYADQLLSSPEDSPVCDSHPEAGLASHRSPSDSDVADQTFDQATFATLGAHSPLSSSSAHTCQACTSDARSVPDCLSASDMREIPDDCTLHHDDFCLLDLPQVGSLDQAHRVPPHALPGHSGLLNQSAIPTESNHYSNREQAEISILAQQISSLASSFTISHSLNPLHNVAVLLPPACDWPHSPPSISSVLPPKREAILDDSVLSSILKDLDMAAGKSSLSIADVPSHSSQQGDLLPAEQFAVMGGFELLLGHQDQDIELHQLDHYVERVLQQDGLAEENLQ